MPQNFWLAEGVSIGDGDEVANSLAARIIALQAEAGEIEHHIHNVERWRGKLAAQTATDWADDTLSPFRAISGLNAYGADANDEALVLGVDDTPIRAGMVYYDPHVMLIVDSSSQTSSKIRMIYGSGTMAAAIAAGQYSETMFHLDVIGGQEPHAPVEIRIPRLRCGIDQVWVQHWNATNNAFIDFLVGIHEYNA